MARVELETVRKTFGGLEVVHGVDLLIEDHQFVVLVGPSGCGKTTLLRMIAGLESVSGGEIRIGGERVNELHPRQRNIAMVFQNYALYAHMTVYDNMAFALRLKHTPKPDIDRAVRNAAEILDLTPLLARYPRQLSGGQRQRVAMGRALVRQPNVFLFDEPLSNLDAKLRVQMRVEIKALQQRLQTTTVYVTHDQIEAMTMADKIVVLNHGRIEQMGSPLELYDQPANLFVAGFIGSPAMNFLPGRVTRNGAGPAVTVGDDLSVPLPAPGLAEEGREVVLGVRPEAFRLDGGEATLPLAVGVIEPTGRDIQVYGKLGRHDVCALFTGRYRLRSGETIRLGVDPTQLHLFDAASGASLTQAPAGARPESGDDR